MPSSTDSILAGYPSDLRGIFLFSAASTLIEDLLSYGGRPLDMEKYRFRRWLDRPRTPVGLLTGDIPGRDGAQVDPDAIKLATLLRRELGRFRVSSGVSELQRELHQVLDLGEGVEVTRLGLSYPRLNLTTGEASGYPKVMEVHLKMRGREQGYIQSLGKAEQAEQIRVTQMFYIAASQWPVAQLIGERDLKRLTGCSVERR